ncbi:MAG: PIN domain-containing protein [Opitutae bacterium]|nr:PIN domain-containing protein [Opitutae bacterium]
MIVLDTHALLWWTLDPEKLSNKAATICGEIEQRGAYLSSISIWELGVKIRNGKLDLGMSIRDYDEKLERLGWLEIVPIDEWVWIRSLELDWGHRDPADRVIVATGLTLGLPLLTRDNVIGLSGQIQCIW